MKTFYYSILIGASLFLTACASYPNYYIKDSTITTQQQTTQTTPVWGVTTPVYNGWGAWGWGGGWGAPGWYGWGWNNRWGCW